MATLPLLFLLPWLFPPVALAETLPPKHLLPLLDTHQVLILGEIHKKPESTSLLTNLAREYTEFGECLTIALEIPADQQAAIDQGPVSAIKVNPIIDHPGYRSMLADLRGLRLAGQCINILAVDAPKTSGIYRDTHMADRIYNVSQKSKVLALVGNLHAFKKKKWRDVSAGSSLAELLLAKDVELITILQKWEEPFGKEPKGSLVNIDEKLANYFLKPVAEFPPGIPEDYADKVIIWGNDEASKSRKSTL